MFKTLKKPYSFEAACEIGHSTYSMDDLSGVVCKDPGLPRGPDQVEGSLTKMMQLRVDVRKVDFFRC